MSPHGQQPAPAAGELTQGEQPLAATEPETYQTEVVYSSGGGSGDRYFVARSGDMRRVDTYKGDHVAATELLVEGKRYVIDPIRKMYFVDPLGDKPAKLINPAALAFFQNAQNHEFKEVSREGTKITYRAVAKQGDPDQEVTITMDTATRLMVRQEVKGKDTPNPFTFELKNVKLEAPAELFALPAGYKEVGKDEFKPAAPKKSHE